CDCGVACHEQLCCCCAFFFFSSRRRHTRLVSDWSSDVCSSDLGGSVACRGQLNGAARLHDRRCGSCLHDCDADRHHHDRGPAPEIGRAACRGKGERAGGGVRVEKKEEEGGVKRSRGGVEQC